MPDLQILQHLTGHRCRHTDHGSDPEHRRNPGKTRDTKDDHQEGRHNQCGNSESANGIVAGTDEPHEVSGDCREEEPSNNHHHRGHHGGDHVTRKVEVDDKRED
jgi:hypothetical protein